MSKIEQKHFDVLDEAAGIMADAAENCLQDINREKLRDFAATYCELPAIIRELQAENEALRARKPVGYLTHESVDRLRFGGNESRRTVPLHADKSRFASIPLFAAPELLSTKTPHLYTSTPDHGDE